MQQTTINNTHYVTHTHAHSGSVTYFYIHM